MTEAPSSCFCCCSGCLGVAGALAIFPAFLLADPGVVCTAGVLLEPSPPFLAGVATLPAFLGVPAAADLLGVPNKAPRGVPWLTGGRAKGETDLRSEAVREAER